MDCVKNIFCVLLLLCILIMPGQVMAATDIADGVIRAEGICDTEQTFSQKRRAAKLLAQRALLEQIHGVQIDSKTTVENAVVTSDVINASVSGLIKGAREAACFSDEYGFVHVVMELPVYGGINSLASVVLPSLPQKNFLPPSDIIPMDMQSIETSTAVDSKQVTIGKIYGATGQYTGLIVDCSGLGLQTAMAPAIYTEGDLVVYGLENFSREQVINRGYVGYSDTIATGAQRAGSNPLVVQAQSIERFFNPIISKDDAAKILAENQMSGFLSSGNVVFIN